MLEKLCKNKIRIMKASSYFIRIFLEFEKSTLENVFNIAEH